MILLFLTSLKITRGFCALLLPKKHLRPHLPCLAFGTDGFSAVGPGVTRKSKDSRQRSVPGMLLWKTLKNDVILGVPLQKMSRFKKLYPISLGRWNRCLKPPGLNKEPTASKRRNKKTNTSKTLAILLVTCLGWWKRDLLKGYSWPPSLGGGNQKLHALNHLFPTVSLAMQQLEVLPCTVCMVNNTTSPGDEVSHDLLGFPSLEIDITLDLLA